MSKKHFYSVKKRLDYTKTKTCFEVMVRMPEYKPFPISVGGRKPFTFWTYDEAKADCERRIAADIAKGIEASFEDYDYTPSGYDYQVVYEDMLDDHNQLVIKFSPKDYEAGENAYCWTIRFFDENGEYYGSHGSGQWHDTQASCEAAARIYYLMEEKEN